MIFVADLPTPRLTGLPRLAKKQPKKPASPPKANTKSLASPPKLKAKSLASPPKPKAKSLASPPKSKAASLPSSTAATSSAPNAEADLTLSDSSLSALSSDEDSDAEHASPKPTAAQKGKGKAPVVPLAFPFLLNPASLPALPALPPLPPLPKTAPKPIPGPSAPPTSTVSGSAASKPAASTSSTSAAPRPAKPVATSSSTPASKPSITSTPQSSKPSSAANSTSKARTRSRKDAPVPSPSTAAPRPKAATPKPASAHGSGPASTSDGSYAPHVATSRSTPSAPQRTSLRQVLALSLQEADEQAKSPAMSRENSSENKADEAPEPAFVSGRGKGLPQVLAELERKERERVHEMEREKERERAKALERVRQKSKGQERQRFDDVSELELDGEEGMSASSVLSDVEGEETSSDELELQKEEERLLRAEFERKARRRRGNDAMQVDQDTTDDEDIAEAWDRNVRAMERLRRRGDGESLGLDTSLQDEHDVDEDSDLAVTEIPPGNGLGVVTWSDYEYEEDEDEDDEVEGEVADATAVAEALAEDAQEPDVGDETLAAKFEDELERLFALSEAVVGPVQSGEYDLGNMWLEALSDLEDGTEADDQGGSGEDEDEDDTDAEMIFGPDGELKKLFGRRKKRRRSAVDSSAGESDGDEEGLSSNDVYEDDDAELDDIELVRIGVALEEAEALRRRRVGEEGNDADYDEDLTSVYATEDEATDSSCSETDIYRYAPRTSSLSALQTPTTVELASLNADPFSANPAPRKSSKNRSKQQKGKAKAPLPAIPESVVSQVSAAVAKSPHRRGPILGSFEPAKRVGTDMPAPLKVIVIDESGVPAPSPFSAPRKTKRRIVRVFPRHTSNSSSNSLLQLDSTSSRRIRADSRFSSTSGTSGAESADMASNVGSPVLANVDFGFDFDSVLHESLLVDEEMRDGDGTSSETDANGATTDGGGASSKAGTPLSDFSRWSRIPIGAFRSRTVGAAGSSAPSQVFAANAAASGKVKKSNVKKDSKKGAAAMLRDRKAAAKLDHTLGSPGQAASTSKKSIASRMLTSPVLAPVIRRSSATSASNVTNATPSVPSAKKAKRSRRATPASSTRGTSPSKTRSRAASSLDAGLTAAATASALTAPTASLPPLHSPLFRSVTDSALPPPSSFQLD